MRAQPWYQTWFKSQNLDPNHVKLNDKQRAELAQQATVNGMPLPKGTIIDPAGNVNTHHGFAGQPGWLKALEIGGAGVAGAMFGGPAIMSLLGHGATAGSAAGAASGVGSVGAGGAATAAGTSALAPALTAAGTSAIPALSGLNGAPITGSGPLAGTGTAPLNFSSMTPSIGNPSTSITGIAHAAPSVTGSVPSSGGNLMSRLLPKGDGSASDNSMGDISKMMEAYANDEQANRLSRGNQSQNYDRLMLDAAANRRLDETDAMRKIGESSYILGGGSQFKPPTISLGGQMRTAPDLGYGPQAPSDASKAAATTLQEQMLKRIQPNGSYTPTPLDSYSQPGAGEKVGKYGSIITSGLSAARNIFGF